MSEPNLTDPHDNPLIPPGDDDDDPLLSQAGNSLIPEEGEAAEAERMKQRVSWSPAEQRLRWSRPEEIPDQPSLEYVEAVLKKFIKTSNAMDYERIKAILL